MRHLSCIAAALLACSCNGATVGEQADGLATPASTATSEADVFIMRMPAQDRVVALARFEGAFVIENGCLIFTMGDRRYLPAFAEGSPVTIDAGNVRIGSRVVALGERMVLSGAQVGASDIPSTTAKPPERCNLPVLRIV